LPGVDKLGRAGYFDLTYIIPFGDIVSGQVLQPREGENLVQAALREQPLLNVIGELAANKDFFGKPIVKPDSLEPEEKGLDILEYLAKFYLPPSLLDFPLRLKQSFDFEALTPEEQKTFSGGTRQTKTVAQEALRGLVGIKIQPYDAQTQASLRDNEKVKALKEFLKAKGVTAEFKRTFIPKKKGTSIFTK